MTNKYLENILFFTRLIDTYAINGIFYNKFIFIMIIFF